MIMAIDVGNTNIKVGVIDSGSTAEEFKIQAGFRITTSKKYTSDELGIRIKTILRDNINRINPYKLDAIICSSVVPSINHTITNMAYRYLGHVPYFVDHTTNLGMNIHYPNLSEIGADRLTNAVAVNKIYKAPAIIIDFGTATTFCALSKTKGYLGGLIVPGVLIGLEALFTRTAKLPQIELVTPKSVIGKSTMDAMTNGTYYSAIGTVEKICDKIRKEMDEDNTKIVATGGLAKFLSTEEKLFDYIDPYLPFKGILEIYKLNKNKCHNMVISEDIQSI